MTKSTAKPLRNQDVLANRPKLNRQKTLSGESYHRHFMKSFPRRNTMVGIKSN